MNRFVLVNVCFSRFMVVRSAGLKLVRMWFLAYVGFGVLGLIFANWLLFVIFCAFLYLHSSALRVDF